MPIDYGLTITNFDLRFPQAAPALSDTALFREW